MLSRAHLLIKRDVHRFEQESPWGIELLPLVEDKMFEWTARIMGPKDTIWDGGIFRMYIKFDEYYNAKPPEVCFHTIPFHPNVDPITGKPCIDLLDNWTMWKENQISISTMLISIQMLLSNPVLEKAVNSEAASLLRSTPHSYNQIVQDCVTASRRVEAGLNPHPNVEPSVITLPPTRGERQPSPPKYIPPAPTPSNRKAAKVSFDDYHSTWSNIATSRPSEKDTNLMMQMYANNAKLQAKHYGLTLEEFLDHQTKENESYATLMYGNFEKPSSKKNKEKDNKVERIEQLNKMKKLYLQQRTPTLSARVSEQEKHQQNLDPWEKEVDDLVAWTDSLNAEEVAL